MTQTTKKITYFIVVPLCLLFCLILLTTNCSLFKPKFDPVGHQYAVTLQEEALALMNKANESFSLHSDAVYRLMTRVEKAYEHSRLLVRNDGVTGIWEVLRDPTSNRLGRFMWEWEKEDILDDQYIKETRKLVEENFKVLIEIEEGKKK